MNWFSFKFRFLNIFRIDVTVNDLPWNLKPDSVPSIIFFPASDKSRSAVFQPSTPHLYHSSVLAEMVLFVRQHQTAVSGGDAASFLPGGVPECRVSSCVHDNMAASVRTIRKLRRRIRRLEVAVRRVQLFLGTQLLVPLEPELGNEDRSGDDDDFRNLLDEISPKPVPVSVTPDDAIIDASSSSTPVPGNIFAPPSSTELPISTCNVTRILHARDELASLRHRLFRQHESLSTVLYVYQRLRAASEVAASPHEGTRYLPARHWHAFHRLKIRLAFRLHGYRDFESGSDLGIRSVNVVPPR